jgi:hypothetical protein
MSRYPYTRYETRSKHINSDEFYTLGSDDTLKKAKISINYWRKTSPEVQWILVKATNIANGVIKRTTIDY